MQKKMRINNRLNLLHAVFIMCLLLVPATLRAQTNPAAQKSTDTSEIEIRQADYLEIIQTKRSSFNKLVNNVILVQKELVLYCDSALLYKDENIARVYGNVHFVQGDSIHAYGDSASYDGNTKMARLYSNVRLTDNTMTLETNTLTYDLLTKSGTYLEGGTIDDGETVLSSKYGYYYANSNDAFFKKDVVLVNPDYKLEADTLQYNTSIERAIFHGPTTIYNEESTVYCEKGYYDTKSGVAVFYQNAKLDNPPQSIEADSIHYNRETGIGEAYGDIVFTDTVQHILQYSQVALYNEIENTILSTSGSIAGFIIESDTLFIAGDTIRSISDSLERRTTLVYHNVRIFKSDLQGICDSLIYSDVDSTIKMHQAPVLWSDSTQFMADTIVLYMKNSELDQIHLYSSGFIINEDDSLIYNQVRGRNIYGYFFDEELRKIEVKGNGESIYFGKDDAGAYIGVNKMICSDIDILLNNKKFQKITFITSPVGEFYPMDQVNPTNYLLQHFEWMYDERPKSKEDLLIAKPQPSETENPSELKSLQKDG